MVQLAARGRAVIQAARAARSAQEAKLQRAHGAAALASCKALLAGILEDLGGADAVCARRVRPPK